MVSVSSARALKVDPQIYDTYAGEYQLAPTFTITVTREGDRLTAQATGQPRFDMFPESETKFFLRLVDADFVREGWEGAVTHLILHQGGMDQTGRKIK